MNTKQIAEEAAEKIHWAHVKKPDAYTQEDIARTRTIIQAAIEKAMQAWLTSGNPNDYPLPRAAQANEEKK